MVLNFMKIKSFECNSFGSQCSSWLLVLFELLLNVIMFQAWFNGFLAQMNVICYSA